MFQFKVLMFVFLVSVSVFSKAIVLSPDNLSTAFLKVSFERSVRLDKENKFRFPVIIDSNNRCFLTPLTLTTKKSVKIDRDSEWTSINNSSETEWGSKSYSFKLANNKGTFLMKCDLNLAGEILLFNSTEKNKSESFCRKQGGKMKLSPPRYTFSKALGKRVPASVQKYCIKQIPKVTLSRFKTAFQNAKLNVNVDFPVEEEIM